MVEGTGPRSPSMLDLVRLSPRRLFPPGGEDLYRQIALLSHLSPGQDLLDVACGKGIVLEYFVREYEVHGTGVEEDSHLLDLAEAHLRETGLAGAANFQKASPSDLPFRDGIFDVVVGELGLNPQRMFATVHHTDDEAAALWEEVVGLPPERIYRLGDKDNFWQMANTGPCGPCSEIFFDHGQTSRVDRRGHRMKTAIVTSRSGTSCSCNSIVRPMGP